MKTQTHRSILITLAAVTLLLAAGAARAVDFHVATAQDLQNALTLAAANGSDDTIYLAAGYYTGNLNFNSAEPNSLTLQVEPGVTNQVNLDGAGTGRTMSLSCSANANITVRGLTFLRNCGDGGIGALRIATGPGGDILVDSCRFLSRTNTSGMGLELVSGLIATVSGCSVVGTQNGGGTGISISGITGNVIVQNCLVTANSGSGLSIQGGSTTTVTDSTFNGNGQSGVWCRGTTITLSGNTFTGNGSYCGWGGGGACCYAQDNGAVTLSGNIFSGNSINGGSGGGAGCCIGNGGTVTLSGNTFNGNGAWGNYQCGGGHGGGAYCSGNGAVVILSGNTFTGNWCQYDGGGTYCGSSTVLLTNNAFTANWAGGNGGATCCSAGTVTLAGNTAKQNTAVSSGGGFYVASGTVTFLDNLVLGNTQTGSGYYGGGVCVDARTELDMINNTVFGNNGFGGGGGVAFQVDGVTEILHVYNNIIWGNETSGNGADVYLAGTGQRKEFLFNNTDDMFGVWDIAQNLLDVDPQFFDPINGDYHLRSTSGCANAGDVNASSLPATDLDGNSRTNSAGMVDLGCYEFNNSAFHPSDTDTNWVISIAEFNAYAAAWQNSLGWTTGPNLIPANFVTRAGFLLQSGGIYHNDGSAQPVNWKPGAQ